MTAALGAELLIQPPTQTETVCVCVCVCKCGICIYGCDVCVSFYLDIRVINLHRHKPIKK